jgi:hypothetical protein
MADGRVYERAAIQEDIALTGRSRVTGKPLKMENAKADADLEARIAKFAQKLFPARVHIGDSDSQQDFTIEVALWDTVAQVKRKIAANGRQIPPSFRLIVGNQRLEDDDTLEDSDVYETRQLNIKDSRCTRVLLINGPLTAFDIYPNDTMLDMKIRYEKDTGIARNRQAWTFQGKPLQDNQLMAQLGLKYRSRLILTVRTTGGLR